MLVIQQIFPFPCNYALKNQDIKMQIVGRIKYQGTSLNIYHAFLLA